MEHNQNTFAAINHQHTISIKFHDHSWQSSVAEETGRCMWWLLLEVQLYLKDKDQLIFSYLRASIYQIISTLKTFQYSSVHPILQVNI